MNKLLKPVSLFLFAVSCSFISYSQYILNGSATQNSCNCYTLTQAINTQAGSVWNSIKINLNNSFDFYFNVFLGCADANGADGIVFMLQPNSTSVGASGEGMGFQNVDTSVGISLDTWQNTNQNDPSFDHISIQTNGYINHDGSLNNLTPPVQASATNINIEDCQWHVLRVTWDATTHWLRAYFDEVLRVEAQKDLVNDIFYGDPMVYWGFTAATGGANNLQQFCTALNPDFTTNFSNNVTCLDNPVQFTDASQSFTNIQTFYWNFGDGNTSNLQDPVHNYTSPGVYTVKHVITGADGCVSDTMTKTVTIGSIPVADFTVIDTCYGFLPQVVEQSTSTVGVVNQWTWVLDGNFLSNNQQPTLPVLPAGVHTLQLFVATEFGCSGTPLTKSFTIKPTPVVNFSAGNGCVNQLLSFNGQQTDNQTTILQWNWDFGDGSSSTQQNLQHAYSTASNYTVQLYAIASNGCRSATVQHTLTIGASPQAQFIVGDTCAGNSPALINQTTISSGSVAQWNWLLDGQPFSNTQTPSLPSNLSPGNHTLQLTATGNTGCVSNSYTASFVIRPVPAITANVPATSCYNQPAHFTAAQTDNQTTIQQWNWNFGDGKNSAQQNPSHVYSTGGSFTATIQAVASNGCASASLAMPVKIDRLTINAGNDTVVVKNIPFTLQGAAASAIASNLSYNWQPTTGLNNPTVLQPVSILQNDIVYHLTVQSDAGCVATDSVKITVFAKAAIYVPSAFTPNNDGLNDLLLPKYAGMKELKFFKVFNRWGQQVFYTTDMSKGWDGMLNGKPQPTGSYVWVVNAVDVDGKLHMLKGTIIIIR